MAWDELSREFMKVRVGLDFYKRDNVRWKIKERVTRRWSGAGS